MASDDDSSVPQSSTDIFGWAKFGEELGEYGEEAIPLPEQSTTFYLDRYESPGESEMMLEVLGDVKGKLMEQIKTVLYNLITDRPENVADYFEEYIRNVIIGRPSLTSFINMFTHYLDYETLVRLNQLSENLRNTAGVEEGEEGGEGAAIKREYNFIDRMENFEDSGLTLSKLEIIGVLVAINSIADDYPVAQVRFWGKIFGLYKNYYIIEAEVTKEMLSKTLEEEKFQAEIAAPTFMESLKMGEEEEIVPKIRWEKVRKLKDYRKPPEPVSTYKPPRLTPKERQGTGVNSKVFFASNEASKGYIQLPDVLPIELVRARQIKRFFTGEFDCEVNTIPSFPGKEINLLRAQIARISAGTQLSPLGFYSFDQGEGGFEEEEEEIGEEGNIMLPRKGYTVNPDFEPIPLKDLVDPSMSYWAHHTAHILPQGRTKWVDPTIDPDAVPPEGGEIEGEEFEKAAKPEPEVGPPLLTPASEDMSLESAPAWCTRLTMELSPTHGGGVTRSNLWLGGYSYSLATDAVYDNVYIGWGHKYNSSAYTPKPYFIPQNEYEIGPEVMEITDPDPEEEDYEGILYEQQLAEEKLQKKLAQEEAELL